MNFEKLIVVEKVNEVFFKLHCSLEIGYALKSRFECFAPGHIFHPKFKAGVWNGRISFFNMKDQTLPIGLYKEFQEFCAENEYEIKWAFDIDTIKNHIKKTEFDELFETLFPTGGKFEVRDYQRGAIEVALRKKRGVIQLPTSAGKSLVIYSLIKFCKESTEGKILLIVPNVALTEQMFGDMVDYGWYDALQHVSVVYSGSENIDFSKRIIISTWQSLQKKDPIFFDRFQTVIVDECHSLNQKSNAIREILKNCVNADYRFGLTGTVPKDIADKYNLFGYIGPVLYSKKSIDLIDKGFISKINIYTVLCRYGIDEIKKARKMSYDTEMDSVINHPKRLMLIHKIVKKINNKENVLILCDRIDHLKRIVESLKSIEGREVIAIHGSIPAKQREEMRAKVENSEGIIIVASFGTMSQGVNVKKLHHVMFASSTKSYTRTIQSIGRGLRLHETKDHLTLWDLVDDMRYKKRTGTIGENYLFEHFKERLKFYKESGFTYIKKTVNLNSLKEE